LARSTRAAVTCFFCIASALMSESGFIIQPSGEVQPGCIRPLARMVVASPVMAASRSTMWGKRSRHFSTVYIGTHQAVLSIDDEAGLVQVRHRC
jgi:hypothetical protein